MTISTLHQAHQPSHPVTIYVNWLQVEVPKGPHTIFDLKQLGHIHGDHVEQLIDGKLVPLHSDSVIHVHGGEVLFTGHVVQIFVNDDPVFVPAGDHTASYIKLAAKQPPADLLDELINGEYKPLKDTDVVKIKGGEHFTCQPKTGKTS
jgi:hypothetical protein